MRRKHQVEPHHDLSSMPSSSPESRGTPLSPAPSNSPPPAPTSSRKLLLRQTSPVGGVRKSHTPLQGPDAPRYRSPETASPLPPPHLFLSIQTPSHTCSVKARRSRTLPQPPAPPHTYLQREAAKVPPVEDEDIKGDVHEDKVLERGRGVAWLCGVQGAAPSVCRDLQRGAE